MNKKYNNKQNERVLPETECVIKSAGEISEAHDWKRYISITN